MTTGSDAEHFGFGDRPLGMAVVRPLVDRLDTITKQKELNTRDRLTIAEAALAIRRGSNRRSGGRHRRASDVEEVLWGEAGVKLKQTIQTLREVADGMLDSAKESKGDTTATVAGFRRSKTFREVADEMERGLKLLSK